MYQLRVSTWIDAPIATCFDLARSVEAHLESVSGTGERVVGGRRSGLLELGDQVTWEGRNFGVGQRLSSRITAMRPPSFFHDRMTRGAFRPLEHDHLFEPRAPGARGISPRLRPVPRRCLGRRAALLPPLVLPVAAG